MASHFAQFLAEERIRQFHLDAERSRLVASARAGRRRPASWWHRLSTALGRGDANVGPALEVRG